ncbi:MAG: hypothetical protein ACREB1_09655 [Sphingomicrobium sp.]
MIRIAPIAALMLLAACGGPESPAPPQANEASAPAKAPAEIPGLKGNWAVSRIGGIPDAASLGMTAAITKDAVTLSTGCFRRAWTYTQNRNVVAFTASPGGSSNCGGSSPGAAAETAYAALTEANIAIFSKDGREANLSGTGGTLTLERR